MCSIHVFLFLTHVKISENNIKYWLQFQDGEPCKVGVAMTDLATGLYAHGAIMAALIQRIQTGKGQKISCDLLSTQVR